MPKVSKQTAAKGGLLTAILGMIGNVVGIGIFFKNGTVFRLNSSNAIGVLVAWVLTTLIVLCMAISFAEIASGKTKSGKAGIGPWAQTFCGHRFGRYANLGYNMIFWPLNTFAVMFFAGEALLNCFSPIISQWDASKGWTQMSSYNYGRGTVMYIFLIGAALFAFFMLINYFRYKNMAKVGKAISFVKFAPLAMVIFIGIICGAIAGGGLWSSIGVAPMVDLTAEANAAVNASASSFNFIGVLACIPAILFSFEGYVAIDSFKNDLSNPDKQIPAGVVLGVVVIAALYLAVTIGCITAGKGDVYQLMQMFLTDEKLYNPVAYQVLTMLISIFIFICLIGCVNGMARGGIVAYQELCKSNTLFKGAKLTKRRPGNDYYAGAVSFTIMMVIWYVIILVPSLIYNTDAIADGSSTSMIICLYVIYGGIVLCGLINRGTKKVEVAKIKVFPVAAVIGVIACLFMIGYVAFFQFTYAPIKNGLWEINSKFAEKAGWGMFVSDTVPTYYALKNLEVMIFFWVMTLVAAVSPILNDLFIKWWDKENKSPLMWQKAPVGKQIA